MEGSLQEERRQRAADLSNAAQHLEAMRAVLAHALAEAAEHQAQAAAAAQELAASRAQAVVLARELRALPGPGAPCQVLGFGASGQALAQAMLMLVLVPPTGVNMWTVPNPGNSIWGARCKVHGSQDNKDKEVPRSLDKAGS